MKFQDKFYDVMDHKKLPSSEKEDEKCVSINFIIIIDFTIVLAFRAQLHLHC